MPVPKSSHSGTSVSLDCLSPSEQGDIVVPLSLLIHMILCIHITLYAYTYIQCAGHLCQRRALTLLVKTFRRGYMSYMGIIQDPS